MSVCVCVGGGGVLLARLPQVSFLTNTGLLSRNVLSRQTYFCRDKHNFCRDKSFATTSLLLSRQTRFCPDRTRPLSREKYACHDKTFVLTNVILSRQRLRRGKHIFVARKDVFCRDKTTGRCYGYALPNSTLSPPD